MLKQDFEELYTMISSESPPLNAADDIHQKVCCQVHQTMLSYCVYIYVLFRARDGFNYS